MDGFEKHDGIKEEMDGKFRQEIYSKAIKAGKRTYFFDVKSTWSNEYYLTITESKKCFDQSGKFHFEKHKIFLYKEDFEKFKEGLSDVMNFIADNQSVVEKESAPDVEVGLDEELTDPENEVMSLDYTSVEFEDLTN